MHPKQLLSSYHLKPKKSLGQNFLWDPQLLEKVVMLANVDKNDAVVEIGPGLGHLTKQLATAARHVTTVELDDRLLPILNLELAPYDNVILRHADILRCDPASFYPNESYKLVANVPYYITAAILRHFLTSPARPTHMVMTVQKEVATRLSAKPGDLSLLAVSVQAYGRVDVAGTIKAGAFWPAPDVDSAIISIQLFDKPLITFEEEKPFFRVVKAGFAQKRKQLQKNLRALGYPRESINAALEEANIVGQRRAETLAIAEWVALYNALKSR